MNEDAERREGAGRAADEAAGHEGAARPPDVEREESSEAPPEEEAGVGRDARLRVLQLVAEGRLTVDEAAELLSAMEADAAAEDEDEEGERRDVFVHAGPGAMPFTAPVPPMPPMPPMAPMPPMPPMPQRSPRWGARPGPGDVVMYRRGGRADRRERREGREGRDLRGAPQVIFGPGPGRAPQPKQTLLVRTQEGDTETRTRIPLAAAANADAFLPKQAREHLAKCEIDMKVIADNAAELAHGPYATDEPLVHIHEGDTEVRISLE